MSFAPDPTYQGATGWSAQNPATGVVFGGNLGNLTSVAQAVPSGADNRPISQPQAPVWTGGLFAFSYRHQERHGDDDHAAPARSAIRR
jgi:hypothetical protein